MVAVTFMKIISYIKKPACLNKKIKFTNGVDPLLVEFHVVLRVEKSQSQYRS